MVIADVQTKILPGVTHWQSPNYFAYFPSNSSTAGFLGEMLSAGVNIVGFSWITSPAATELEMIVMDWLAKMLKLPDDFLSKGKIVKALHKKTIIWECVPKSCSGCGALLIFRFLTISNHYMFKLVLHVTLDFHQANSMSIKFFK